MSRERILADVRAALATRQPEPADHPHPVWPLNPPVAWPSLAAQFRQRFEGLGGKWHQAASPEELHRVLAGIATVAGGAALVARDPDGLLDDAGVPEALGQRGVTVTRQIDDKAGADRIGLSITAATTAIAESASFGLVVSPGQGRLASVIAPIHVTVLTPDRLVATLKDFLDVAGPRLAGKTASAAILITGPSRTADIEGQLIVGVHGPREVHCVFLAGS